MREVNTPEDDKALKKLIRTRNSLLVFVGKDSKVSLCLCALSLYLSITLPISLSPSPLLSLNSIGICVYPFVCF